MARLKDEMGKQRSTDVQGAVKNGGKTKPRRWLRLGPREGLKRVVVLYAAGPGSGWAAQS